MVGTDALLRKVTRSHKYNERPHGPHSASYQPPAPRYFAKSGHVDADPRKVKKNGGGRMNWGRTGDEVEDLPFTFTKQRRYSNSNGPGLADVETDFDRQDEDVPFDESVHGPLPEKSKHKITKVYSNDSQ